MNLRQHAEREMKLAGLYDEDADYDGMIPEAVMQLIDTFADQGHSGGSAHIVRAIFHNLSGYLPLTPLTKSPEEWMKVEDEMWQSRRRPDAFSEDGGKTYYLLDDDPRKEYISADIS